MKKKNISIVIGLVAVALLVAACSTAANAANTPLTADVKLMVGTMKLDGTANAVTATQASTLLPLWQAYQALVNSSTSAQAEKDAVINQIKADMTADQLKAIDAMNLKQSDIQSLFQQRGFNPTFEGTRVVRTPSANLQAPGAGGNDGPRTFSGGGPGGGGFVFGGGGGPDGGGFTINGAQVTPNASQRATLQAARSNISSSPFMFNLIIRYLENKINPAPSPTPTGQ